MVYVNCTPHQINLNDGRSFEPSGNVARVSSAFEQISSDLFVQTFGDVQDLPEPKEDTLYIVSGMVLSAIGVQRPDIVAPATGHPDTVRDEKGRILSVVGFVR